VNTAGVQAAGLYRDALKGVSLSAEPGELVVVAGVEKSSLLACLAGIDDPDHGTVYIAGERMSHRPKPVRARLRARAIGLVGRRGNLFGHLTVGQNVRFVRSLVAGDLRHDPLGFVGLTRWANAYPGELSAGDLVRAGLAVALCTTPLVLLADEPTGELDSVTELLILDVLLAVAEKDTAVVVASDSPDIAAVAHRVIHLAEGAA
jgi:putative ABC transport system ATP-binding protein